MKNKKNAISLNIYLISKTCKSEEAAFKNATLLKKIQPKSGASVNAAFYYKPPRPAKEPRWVTTLTRVFDIQAINLKNLSSSGVVILNAHGRYFAICFGHGKHFLDDDRIERNFGLKVALNSLPEDQLQIVELLTPEVLSLRTRKQVARASSIGEFNVNTIMDVLKRVTGKIVGDDFAKHITGADSLKISVEKPFEEIAEICGTALKRVALDAYKKNGFDWIDFLQPVKDSDLLKSLDQQIVKEILEGNKHFFMAPPEIEQDQVEGYRYKGKRDQIIYRFLSLDDYLASFKKEEVLTLEDLKGHRVQQIFADDTRGEEWKIYRCLFFDLTYENKHYVLSDGSWYCIDQDYFTRIESAFRSCIDTSLSFPKANPKEIEGDYNVRACQELKAKRFDKVFFKVNGARKEHEFCDIYFPSTKNIVHVKPFHASSNLSHLFNQAKFSAQFFGSDTLFTNAVQKNLGDAQKVVERSKYTVVMAVIREKPEKGAFDLPFFSKVSLIDAVEKIRSYGYKRASLCFIERLKK